jgi:uncharacterized protein
MTPQEQQLLQGLTDRINQTVLNEKDPDAEQFIQQSLGRNPDALYILAQTVLVQQYALDQAKQQLDQLKQQAQQPKHTGSFLGNLLGLNDQPTPPPPPQYAPVNNPAPPPQYYGAPQYAQPGYAPAYAPGYSQGGGFLRSAMQTATGVAAGALAFEGIESLMHGFGQHAGYGMGGFDGGRPEEIINNNYYDGSGPNDRGDLAGRFADAGDHPSTDIEDRRDDTFASSTGNDTLADNDTDNFADSSSFDSGSDDSGSFDSGGSDFGGSGDGS